MTKNKLSRAAAGAGLLLSFVLFAGTFTSAQESAGQTSAVTDKVTSGSSSSQTGASASSTDWNGFYVGAYGGLALGRANARTSTVYSGTGYFAQSSVDSINSVGDRNIKDTSFTGGGQLGYNRQFGKIVVGGEVDFGSQRLNKSDAVTTTYPCCSPTTYTISQSVKTNWVLTARPRVGYAAGKALFYGTGGLALTDVNYAEVFTDTFDDALETNTFKKTRAGYAAGGGVEVKVAKHWSAKGEYLYNSFGRVSSTSSGLTTSEDTWPDTVFTHSVRLKSHNVRFGVNYSF